jgi:hypothetical protein
MAFALIILFFAQGVERQRRGSIPLVLVPEEAVQEVDEGGAARELAGRRFELAGGLWHQQGAAPDAAATRVEASTREGQAILEGLPELTELLASGGGVRLLWQDRVVELYRD